TPDGIEAILRTSFAQILGATHGVTGDMLWVQSLVLSFESYGSVANFGMNLRATIPRIPVDNVPGNQTAAGNQRDFAELSKRGRQIANGLAALDRLINEQGSSLGSEGANNRAKAFGYFTLGLANGELALMYDSVATPTVAYGSADSIAAEAIPPLVGYAEAMTTALAQLDTAILVAESGDFDDLDDSWLRLTGDNNVTRDDFVRIVRSTRARLRAGVARTPAERAQGTLAPGAEGSALVDWNLVLADAQNGITGLADSIGVVLDLNDNEGWGVDWLDQLAVYSGWHMMPPPIIGMADTSGNYRTWLAQPIGSKAQFLIHTPDTRFPAGADRATQQENSPSSSDVLPDVYFNNRDAGDDTPGAEWANSPYDFARFRNYRRENETGPWVWMAKTEIDMLAAEALIRLGRATEALPLVNASRTQHGLAPFTSATGPAPLHSSSPISCVPLIPDPETVTAEMVATGVKCGDLFEAMKWEKRMETAMTGYAQWFLDSRGWGDLAEGTTYMWPVPFQEMQSREKPFYNSPWQAPRGTYGF
ncbi:MAG TPA: hypothetical protein VFS08_09745, partial [Gemmatimonadaceae bacterium]|nr:hypothetical protein [Gemmatimonadaceae bacterium]